MDLPQEGHHHLRGRKQSDSYSKKTSDELHFDYTPLRSTSPDKERDKAFKMVEAKIKVNPRPKSTKIDRL